MKKLCILMAILIALGFMTGCNQNAGNPETQTTAKGVEITVVSPFDSEDGNRDNFVRAYKAYETATGNTVKDLSSASNEEWKAKVTADFEAGNEPDVLFYFTGADANKLVQSGRFVSLSEIRKAYPDYASNMKDSMMPVSTFDGRQYVVPVNGYWEGLFVNKKVLEACDIAVPGADYTWDQFLEDCRIIRDNGYIPIACSLMEVPHYWFEYCTFNNGSLSNHASLPASSEDEIGKIWAAGFMDIKELYDNGFFPENTNSATDSETNLLMTENRAAFMIDGSWKVGWFQSNASNIDDFAVTYVPAKGERMATDIVGGLSMGYYITKNAWDDPQKRDACVEFIRGMTTDAVVSSFGALSVTALKNGTEPAENIDSLARSALDMTKGCTGIVSAAQDSINPDARTALFGDVKDIVTGSITPEKAIDNCLFRGETY